MPKASSTGLREGQYDVPLGVKELAMLYREAGPQTEEVKTSKSHESYLAQELE